jgi:hypothetical protein
MIGCCIALIVRPQKAQGAIPEDRYILQAEN